MKAWRWWLLAASTVAHADPPAPVSMPELVSRSEVRMSLLVSNLSPVPATNDTLFELEAAGRVRILEQLEAFGEASAFHLHMRDDDYGTAGYNGLRNTRVGARGFLPISERVVLGIGAWSWLPTAATPSHEPDYLVVPEQADLLRGLSDPYAMHAGFALGGAIDLRWSRGDTFVQGELGATAVTDAGALEVDDASAALGYGDAVDRCTTVTAELRVVQQPTGAHYDGARFWMFSLALARLGLEGTTLRVRAGVGVGSLTSGVPAFLIAIDGFASR